MNVVLYIVKKNWKCSLRRIVISPQSPPVTAIPLLFWFVFSRWCFSVLVNCYFYVVKNGVRTSQLEYCVSRKFSWQEINEVKVDIYFDNQPCIPVSLFVIQVFPRRIYHRFMVVIIHLHELILDTSQTKTSYSLQEQVYESDLLLFHRWVSILSVESNQTILWFWSVYYGLRLAE